MYQVNFLSWRNQRITRKKRLLLILSLIHACILTLVIGYFASQQYLTYQHLHLTKQQHQQDTEQRQQLVQQMTEKQTQLDNLLKQKQRSDKQRQSNLALIDFLQALPSLTPKKSWLAAFSLWDQQISLQANSYDFHDISQLFPRLEKNPRLHTIELTNMGRSKQVNYIHLKAHYLEAQHE